MKKILLALVIAGALSSCVTYRGPMTTYKARIMIGDKFIYRRSDMAVRGFMVVDTVKVMDGVGRCVKLRNQDGVEQWISTVYIKEYITKIR